MKCDLHCHTSFSYDSWAKPGEMVKAAIEKGIDCLAITDHNEIGGALESIEYAKGKPILIIPGIEIKSKEGDILGLNIEKIIPNGLSAKETIEKIKEAGGIAIIPHPFGWFYPFRGNLEELIEEVDGVAETSSHLPKRSAGREMNEEVQRTPPRTTTWCLAIEVLNVSAFDGNKKALDFVQRFNLPFTVGSDAHFPNLIGQAYLEIPGQNLSIEEVFKKIKNREGKICGSTANFFEKIIDHSKRNLSKVFKVLP